jgi:CubicO group peptidase (beta-lactamase class C family)
LALPASLGKWVWAQGTPENLAQLLEPIRAANGIPALAGAFIRGSDIAALGAVGLRRVGGEGVQLTDRFHIGSNTKSMTATLLAMLVEQGKLTWEATIADVFKDLLNKIHPRYHKVTLEQLLSHRAGLPEDRTPDPTIWPQVRALSGPMVEQRRRLVEMVLARPPVTEPGARMAYSNFGYTIAGAFAEQVTGQAWEALIRQLLFGPLGMASAGFGPPGFAQPWGHTRAGCQPVPPGPEADNPPVIGPAGTVHTSMSDWARYAALHLRGAQGESGLPLKPETFRHLHRDSYQQGYALGWVVVQRSWAGGTALTHAGSNTLWFAIIWVAPSKNVAFLTATNCGSEGAARACDSAVGAMISKYL